MKRNRVLIALLLLFIFLGISTQPASAHADLVRATPEPNAQLDRAPVLIELIFSEPVEANFSTIQVLDVTGKRVDNEDATVDAANPLRMTATVRSLKDGIYTVSWKTLSLVDSHVTAGVFPFAVGNVDPDALAAAVANQKTSISTGEILFRWLSYIAGAGLLGGTLFIMIVWSPAAKTVKEEANLSSEAHPPWQGLATGALTLLVGANILGLLAQAGQVVDLFIVMPWSPAINTLLFATKYGALWLGRFVLTLIIARFLIFAKTNRDRWIAMAAMLLMLVTFSLNSHAAAEPRPFLPVFADWVHLVGSSLWVGGLIYFIGGLWAIRREDPAYRTRLTALLIPRFSNLAIFSVGLLGLTGIYSAYLRVGAFDALTGTLYGRVLLVKTLLALPMFLLGAINLLHTSPTLRKLAETPKNIEGSHLVHRFRNLVSAEVVFAIFLLLTVGLFTAVPPARAIATDATISKRAQADDLNLQLKIDPGKVGINTFTVNITTNGQPLEGAREVGLQFTPTTVDLPPSQITLDEVGGGVYSAEGAFLSMPDTWQLQVAVRREGAFDAFANFEISVGATASSTFPWTRVNSFLLLLSGVLYLLTLRLLQKEKSRTWQTVRGPAIALVLAAIFVCFLPSSRVETLVNPIPPNRASVASGQALYRTNCLQCHGPTGRGDGPVGLTLNPPPADLYAHTQPGVHPDGRLFGWISDGVSSDSAMPAFRSVLSDEERWNLVNYIRTFAREAEGDNSQP